MSARRRRTSGWAQAWTTLRLAAALLILAAIVTQATRTVQLAVEGHRDLATTLVNFFSFFTILSNVGAVIVLAWAATWLWTRRRRAAAEPRGLSLTLVSVTTYMIVTGVVYNLLLRGIALAPGTTVPWTNEVLHVAGPLFLLVDLFVGPARRRSGWGAVLVVLVFPIVWVVYTLVRGPLTVNPVTGAHHWYPYPFLDPQLQPWGYGGVALYVAGIAVAIGAIAALAVWVGRQRGRRRAAGASSRRR